MKNSGVSKEKEDQIRAHIVTAFQAFAAHQILISELFGDLSLEMEAHNRARWELEQYAAMFGLDVEMMYDGVTERKVDENA